MWSRAAALVVVASCGRLDFDPLVDGGGVAKQPIAWVGTFVQLQLTTPTTITFTGQAHAAGNAVLIHVACDAAARPTPTASAPGWTFQQLGTVEGQAGKWATALGAIAPGTVAALFTVTWDMSCAEVNALGDEFAHTAPTGAFENTTVVAGTTDCISSVTTISPNAAIWAACSSGGTVTGVADGLVKSADDGHDDWSGYKLTMDAPNTIETGRFTTASGGMYTMTMTSLEPE